MGGRPATLGTALDVRERRHAQESVAKAQRLDAVARLAGGIAHDFNNALQVILGHAERVVGALPESHPVHAVGASRSGVPPMRAAHLTDRLLSFGQRQLLDPQAARPVAAHPRSQGPDRAPPRTGASAWCCAGASGRRRCAWIARDSSTCWPRWWINAREAMPQGGQLVVATDIVTIDAAARAERPWLRTGEYVQLAVEDSGPGLDAEATTHAFEPFYTHQGDAGTAWACRRCTGW